MGPKILVKIFLMLFFTDDILCILLNRWAKSHEKPEKWAEIIQIVYSIGKMSVFQQFHDVLLNNSTKCIKYHQYRIIQENF